MDHLVSDFFLNLAQVSIGFVAFSTIAVVLREMMGTPLDAYQTLLVRFVIECGLAATIYALAPVLLAIVGLTPPTLWRVASAALGVFCLVYPVHYVHRRRRARSGSMPPRAVWVFLGTMTIDAELWLNAHTDLPLERRSVRRRSDVGARAGGNHSHPHLRRIHEEAELGR
jgi:hypothetical protein